MWLKHKVLYLAPSSGFGGAETFLLNTARFHHSARYKPHYVCFRDGPLVNQLRALGASVSLLPHAPRLSRPASFLRAVRWIQREASFCGAELIHSTMAYGALFGGAAAKLAGIPHVWFQHGPVSGWMDRLAAAVPSEAVLVNSSHTAQLQRKLGGRQNLRQLTLGVDLDRVRLAGSSGEKVTSIRERWGIPSQAFLVGAVCRPQPQKGLELFIRAVNSASLKGDRAIHGVILGGAASPSAHERSLLKLIEELKAPVRLLPATPLALEEMRAFDLLASSSVGPEGFGLTLIESMALGVPVIAPREGGPLDILSSGQGGHFFEPRDAEDLAQKILLSSSMSAPDWETMKGAARAQAELRFSAEHSVRNLENLYDEVLSSF